MQLTIDSIIVALTNFSTIVFEEVFQSYYPTLLPVAKMVDLRVAGVFPAGNAQGHPSQSAICGT